jgi:hypothetical protein
VRIAALLVVCAAAAAEVEAPLGPYARPGIPVLLASETAQVVDLEGWRFAVHGPTWVHPPRLPCAVRDPEGKELLFLSRAPGEVRLVGVVGDVPADLGDGVLAVPIRPHGMAPTQWRALDLFDRILITGGVAPDADWMGAVREWVRAGGSLVAPFDPLPSGAGLGSWHTTLERAGPIGEPRIPRPGNVRPDVYGLVARPAAHAPALVSARWIVAGTCLALALQLLLAACGRMGGRLMLAGTVLVALIGGGVGLIRPRADYAASARGTIEISYFGGGVERRRSYLVWRRVGPGARATDVGTPVLFREGGDPWWEEPGRGSPLQEGMTRIFLDEQVRARTAPGLRGGEPPPAFWERERPRGAVRSVAAGPAAPPRADRAAIPVLRRIEVVLQD